MKNLSTVQKVAVVSGASVAVGLISAGLITLAMLLMVFREAEAFDYGDVEHDFFK